MFVTFKWKLFIIIFIVIMKPSLQGEGELSPKPKSDDQSPQVKPEVSEPPSSPGPIAQAHSEEPSDDVKTSPVLESHVHSEGSEPPSSPVPNAQAHSEDPVVTELSKFDFDGIANLKSVTTYVFKIKTPEKIASDDAKTSPVLESHVHSEGAEPPSSPVPNAQAHSENRELSPTPKPDGQAPQVNPEGSEPPSSPGPIAQAHSEDRPEHFNVKRMLESSINSNSLMVKVDLEQAFDANAPIDGKQKFSFERTYYGVSFSDLLKIWKNQRKILKINFKSTSIFRSAVPTMIHFFTEYHEDNQPWLYADILVGPGPGDSPKVQALQFIKTVKDNFPHCMLSLGWTTKKPTKENNGEIIDKYTQDNVDEMHLLLKDSKYMHSVNYTVRAEYAINSTKELKKLLSYDSKSTLMIWCDDETEIIDYTKLVTFIKAIGIGRVLLDLPADITKNLSDHYYTNEVNSNASVGIEYSGTAWDLQKH